MFETIKIKDVKVEIGELIKTIRKNRDMTQLELADRLNVSRNTISNLESGKNFTIDTLLKTLKELDLLDRIFNEVSTAKTQFSDIKSLY